MNITAAIATLKELLDPPPYSVEYHNDVGPNDESFWEWWTVAGVKFDDEKAATAFLAVLMA
jgi:hypothetical protein